MMLKVCISVVHILLVKSGNRGTTEFCKKVRITNDWIHNLEQYYFVHIYSVGLKRNYTQLVHNLSGWSVILLFPPLSMFSGVHKQILATLTLSPLFILFFRTLQSVYKLLSHNNTLSRRGLICKHLPNQSSFFRKTYFFRFFYKVTKIVFFFYEAIWLV